MSTTCGCDTPTTLATEQVQEGSEKLKNTILLVGNPNVGKSTIFNALTGGRQVVRNAPGTTVEVFQGAWKDLDAKLLDLPGTYSLLPTSPDEAVVSTTMAGAPGSLTDPQQGGSADLVIAILDATALDRSLYLLGQVAQAGHPVVAAVTMQDIAASENQEVDTQALSEVLGVPVIGLDARKRANVKALSAVVADALEAKPHVNNITADPHAPGARGFFAHNLENDDELGRANELFEWTHTVMEEVGDISRGKAKPSFSDRIDSVLLNPLLGTLIFLFLMWAVFYMMGSDTVAYFQDLFAAIFDGGPDDIPFSLAQGVSGLLAAVGLGGGWLESFLNDAVVTGMGVVASFVPLMFIMFVAIAIMEDSGYMARAAFLGDRLMRAVGLDGRVILPMVVGFGCNLPALAAIRTLPNSKHRLVATMIVPWASCSARVTIYVMMAKIFFGNQAGNVVFAMYLLSLLLIVLGGLALKPFVTKRESQAPLLLVLPPYQRPKILVLLHSAIMRAWAFIKGAGYIIVIMTIVVWLLMATPIASPSEADIAANAKEISSAEAKVDQAQANLQNLESKKVSDERLAEAENKLAQAIQYVPNELEESYSFGDATMPQEYSLYGRVAGGLAPIFAPAGFDDWHMAGALMTGFVAKETVISSIVASYNMGDDAVGSAEDDGTPTQYLSERIMTTFQETTGGDADSSLPGLAALAFLVFVLAYTPCLATVAEQARQVGWKWATGGVVVQLFVAWVLAVAVYQIGALLV